MPALYRECCVHVDKLCPDFSGNRLMLRIPATLEKGNNDRVLSIAPEFVEFLQATPRAQGTGRVFNPFPRNVGILDTTTPRGKNRHGHRGEIRCEGEHRRANREAEILQRPRFA